MADHPLRSATHHRLGGPLPHQLSNGTRAHPYPIKSFIIRRCLQMIICGISTHFYVLFPRYGQVAHALLTRPPLMQGASPLHSFDLHVLSTPPAFVLSQNQTLKFNFLKLNFRSTALTFFYCLLLTVFLVHNILK